MKMFFAVTFAFALLVNVSGCGGMKGESETKEMIKLMNDTADALEKKDAKKAEELKKKGEELAKKMKDLNLSKDEEKKLEEKYKGDVEKAQKRIEEALKKAMAG